MARLTGLTGTLSFSPGTPVLMRDIAAAMKRDDPAVDRENTREISTALTSFGWRHVKPTIDGKQVRAWMPPDDHEEPVKEP